MPRSFKLRRVCKQPPSRIFRPERETAQRITMTLDEFEAIRLIDADGLTQDECAGSMNVSRATVQAIYVSARKKLADCLVNGAELLIDGGEYELCTGEPHCCHCPNCARDIKIFTAERKSQMRIAVTYENGNIFQHFGHTAQFKVYEVQDSKILSGEVVDTMGRGHSALAGVLRDLNADILICGGIGGGARNALAEAGVKLYSGASCNADEAVKALLADNLVYDPDYVCSHHEHHEGHDCGSHGCGSHSCH